jgi:hypothetical protein
LLEAVYKYAPKAEQRDLEFISIWYNYIFLFIMWKRVMVVEPKIS